MVAKKPFSTGIGYHCWLADDEDPDQRIQTFFFGAAAREHNANVILGTRLVMRALSASTNIRRSDEAYGGRLQLVVGVDAELTTIRYNLRSLPYSGAVDLFVIVIGCSALQFAKNGSAYIRSHVVDNTGLRVEWFVFGSDAPGFQERFKDSAKKGIVVHIMGAMVDAQQGLKRLTNGEVSNKHTESESEYMKDLTRWYSETLGKSEG